MLEIVQQPELRLCKPFNLRLSLLDDTMYRLRGSRLHLEAFTSPRFEAASHFERADEVSRQRAAEGKCFVSACQQPFVFASKCFEKHVRAGCWPPTKFLVNGQRNLSA
jgi:hypothetical protein